MDNNSLTPAPLPLGEGEGVRESAAATEIKK